MPEKVSARHILLLVILGIVTLEIGARALPRNEGEELSRYRELSEGFQDLSQLDLDRERCDQSRYYDYFLFSPEPCSTPTIEVSNFFSARRTPASAAPEDADIIIWMFGGSTMGVPDYRRALDR